MLLALCHSVLSYLVSGVFTMFFMLRSSNPLSVMMALKPLLTYRLSVLLLMCEFALNSTESASTGHTPAYVLLGHEPVLPLEHAVREVTDCPV